MVILIEVKVFQESNQCSMVAIVLTGILKQFYLSVCQLEGNSY